MYTDEFRTVEEHNNADKKNKARRRSCMKSDDSEMLKIEVEKAGVETKNSSDGEYPLTVHDMANRT